MKKKVILAVTVAMMGALAAAIAGEPAYKAGDKVKVQWKGAWYDATVKTYNAAKNCFQIHYDNYSDSWDECVKKNRVKNR